MKTLLKVIGIVAVVGIVGAVIVGAVAFAQGPQQNFNPQNFAGQMGQRGGMGSQMHGQMGGQMDGLMSEDMEETMHAAIADALGMSEADFEAEMNAGKTMFDIATEQGVDVNTVWTAMQSARADAVQQAVANGTLTQEQADWMSQMGQHGGMTGGQMGGHGHGSHGGNGGQHNGDCPYNTAQ